MSSHGTKERSRTLDVFGTRLKFFPGMDLHLKYPSDKTPGMTMFLGSMRSRLTSPRLDQLICSTSNWSDTIWQRCKSTSVLTKWPSGETDTTRVGKLTASKVAPLTSLWKVTVQLTSPTTLMKSQSPNAILRATTWNIDIFTIKCHGEKFKAEKLSCNLSLSTFDFLFNLFGIT